MRLMPEKQKFFHLQLMDPQLYFTFKRGEVLDTSKNILPFLYMEMFSLFKHLKKSPKNINVVIHLLSLNPSTNYDPVLLIKHRCHCVGHSLQHFSS